VNASEHDRTLMQGPPKGRRRALRPLEGCPVGVLRVIHGADPKCPLGAAEFMKPSGQRRLTGPRGTDDDDRRRQGSDGGRLADKAVHGHREAPKGERCPSGPVGTRRPLHGRMGIPPSNGPEDDGEQTPKGGMTHARDFRPNQHHAVGRQGYGQHTEGGVRRPPLDARGRAAPWRAHSCRSGGRASMPVSSRTSGAPWGP